MADFFDPSKEADKNLLHADVRDHDELENVVSSVEWQLIDHFKQRDREGLANYSAFFDYETGSDFDHKIKVRLIGYKESEPGESEAGLKEALRRTIADIVSWVLRDYKNTQAVQSISQGNRSVSYTATVPSWRDWPNGWQTKLKNYNAKIEAYGI